MVVALIACTGSGSDGYDTATGPASTLGNAAPATTAAPTGAVRALEVGATEYGFQLAANKVAAGPVALTLVNRGSEIHQITVVRLAEGIPPDDVVAGLHKGTDTLLAGAVSVGGPNVVPSGGKGTVNLDLAAGKYVMICYVSSPRDQAAHSQKGMVTPFTVEGAPPGPPPVAPATKGTITITGGGYQVPSGLTAGSYRVVNDSERTADAALLKLRPGLTAKDLETFFAGGLVGTPPFTMAGGTTALSPRSSAIVDLEVTAGLYVFVAFVNKPAGGAPQLIPGLLTEVTVS